MVWSKSTRKQSPERFKCSKLNEGKKVYSKACSKLPKSIFPKRKYF